MNPSIWSFSGGKIKWFLQNVKYTYFDYLIILKYLVYVETLKTHKIQQFGILKENTLLVLQADGKQK